MSNTLWQPSCQLKQVRQRAQVFASIRQFFAQRAVLEVETPLLSQATGTDPQLDFFKSSYHHSPCQQTLYLQTSPEFAMKRLLAAGSGSIYQLCKAFRNGESGRFHNPEFTLLEWYRVGFNLSELMDEVALLMKTLLEPTLNLKNVIKIAYKDLFLQKTGLDALTYSPEHYQNYAHNQAIPEAIALCGDDLDLWLDFIFSHKIQPTLLGNNLYLVHSYPASQASLARINEIDSKIADRFEVFIKGLELGNGFFELADAAEQNSRFEHEISVRAKNNRPSVTKDLNFLAALEEGLPDCCGVAIGVDRLLMLLTEVTTIDDVLTFPINRA
ncbi:MAG: EF-P lysine aminoacylase EpmA [Methylococcales bacterium]|nr:EF-P lysine aminoacylase EpmA [Methylococcales bacterium]